MSQVWPNLLSNAMTFSARSEKPAIGIGGTTQGPFPTHEDPARAGRCPAPATRRSGDLSVEDLLTKKVLIRQYVVQADIHPFVKGVDFEGVWRNRVVARIGRTEAAFASLSDLILMKRAAGRPKDLEDLRVLLELEKAPGP